MNSNSTISNSFIEQHVIIIKQVSALLTVFCLPQALALKFFLRNDAIAEVIIGVDHTAGFRAHAWVERAGVLLIGEMPTVNFKPLWKW